MYTQRWDESHLPWIVLKFGTSNRDAFPECGISFIFSENFLIRFIYSFIRSSIHSVVPSLIHARILAALLFLIDGFTRTLVREWAVFRCVLRSLSSPQNVSRFFRGCLRPSVRPSAGLSVRQQSVKTVVAQETFVVMYWSILSMLVSVSVFVSVSAPVSVFVCVWISFSVVWKSDTKSSQRKQEGENEGAKLFDIEFCE